MRPNFLILFLIPIFAAHAQTSIKPEVGIVHTDRSEWHIYDWATAVSAGASIRFTQSDDIRVLAIKSIFTPNNSVVSNDPAYYRTKTTDFRAIEICYRHAIGGSFSWRPTIGAVVALTSIKEQSTRDQINHSQVSPYNRELNGANIAFLVGYCLGSNMSVELQLGIRKSIGCSWRF